MNEWVTPTAVIALLTALGLGTLLPKVSGAIWQWATGREGRKRNENERLQDELDEERAHRRILQESLSEHRIFAMSHGIPLHELPSYPSKPPGKKD